MVHERTAAAQPTSALLPALTCFALPCSALSCPVLPLLQAVQRFEALSDLDKHHTTVEEREEYEQHIRNGVVVYAGVVSKLAS